MRREVKLYRQGRESAKENKSLTAMDAEAAKENKSFTAKEIIIKTKQDLKAAK